MRSAISVVIPARDEGAYIEACVRSVVAQEVDADLEVLVVDGASGDNTAQRARSAGATVLDNPEQSIPTALNRGLAAASGEVLARFDAHAEMPQGYLRACLAALREEPRIGNVGGWRRAEGMGPWGRGVAAALASPFGVGNARIWRPPSTDGRHDTDTVPCGCFPIAVVRDVGGWRADLLANEDYELNYRLRRAGWRVVFDPAVWSVYRPRESLLAVARQYWRYGRWKAAMLTIDPRALQMRQLAPPALLATAAAAVIPTPGRAVARGSLAAYATLLTGIGFTADAGWRTSAVLATMHTTWGAGLAWGALARRSTIAAS